MRLYQKYAHAQRLPKSELRITTISRFYQKKPDEQETIMGHALKSLFAKHPDNAPAIAAPGREWITYGELKSLSQEVRKALRTTGTLELPSEWRLYYPMDLKWPWLLLRLHNPLQQLH